MVFSWYGTETDHVDTRVLISEMRYLFEIRIRMVIESVDLSIYVMGSERYHYVLGA